MQKYLFYSSILFLFCISCQTNDMELFNGNSSEYINYETEEASPAEVYEDYMALMEYLGSSTRSNGRSYPDWYGGCYVEGDSLIVLSTNVEVVPLSTRSMSTVRIKSCENSYNAMDSVVKDISSKFESCPIEMCKNIRGFGIDSQKNEVLVLLSDDNVDSISDFKKNFNADSCIRFAQSFGFESQDLSVHISNKILNSSEEKGKIDSLICGQRIYRTDDNKHMFGASMGFRVKRENGKKGLITAGHFIQRGDSISLQNNNNNKVIGVCARSYYDTIMDAAFCQMLDDDTMLTNRIRTFDNDTDTLSTELAQPPSGYIVTAIGSASKNWGKIVMQSYNLTSTIEKSNLKIIYNDVIIMDFPVLFGDSGGIVYALNKATNTRYTVGTIMGNYNLRSNKDQSTIRDYTQSVCIKAYMIESYFDVTRY